MDCKFIFTKKEIYLIIIKVKQNSKPKFLYQKIIINLIAKLIQY